MPRSRARLHCIVAFATYWSRNQESNGLGKGTARGVDVSNPMMFFVPAIVVVPLVTILWTAQTSLAQPAADACKTEPGSSAPPGSHWYYRVNRTDQRHCWFLGPEGAKVRSQAREAPSRGSSPTRTPQRENAVETGRVFPAPMELAQRTPLEATSTKPHAAEFAAPSSDLQKNPDLNAREPTTNGYTSEHEPTDAQEEMIWPVLTEAERAGLPGAAQESGPGPVLLVGALAMVLLCTGVIFKLARRQTQPYRCDRRVAPRRLRPGQKVRADMSETTARSNGFVRRSVAGARQRPSSVDPAHDIKASLRKVVDELERVAA
jgi:hypothetical protein